MRKSDVLLKIKNFENSLNSLKEGVLQAKDELDKDGVIQRFEFTIEMLWKTLKAILQYHGIECYSPRNCIKEAFKVNIIDDDEIILDMLEDRNLSSHVYNKTTSEEIFEKIKDIYLEILTNLQLQEKV